MRRTRRNKRKDDEIRSGLIGKIIIFSTFIYVVTVVGVILSYSGISIPAYAATYDYPLKYENNKQVEESLLIKAEAITAPPTQQETVDVKIVDFSGKELILQADVLVEDEDEDLNYSPSEEERLYAYKMAFAEAGIEDELGQTLVINVAINNMRKQEYDNLIDEFKAKGRYSSVIDGVPCIPEKGKYRPVRDEDLTDELKAAVDEAFRKDYSEELLKEAMEELAEKNPNFVVDSKYYEGGALYFYCPTAVKGKEKENRANIKVKFQHGGHIFYRFWDK